MLRELALVHVGEQLSGVERVLNCLETGESTRNFRLSCWIAYMHFPETSWTTNSPYRAVLPGLFMGNGVSYRNRNTPQLRRPQ